VLRNADRTCAGVVDFLFKDARVRTTTSALPVVVGDGGGGRVGGAVMAKVGGAADVDPMLTMVAATVATNVLRLIVMGGGTSSSSLLYVRVPYISLEDEHWFQFDTTDDAGGANAADPLLLEVKTTHVVRKIVLM